MRGFFKITVFLLLQGFLLLTFNSVGSAEICSAGLKENPGRLSPRIIISSEVFQRACYHFVDPFAAADNDEAEKVAQGHSQKKRGFDLKAKKAIGLTVLSAAAVALKPFLTKMIYEETDVHAFVLQANYYFYAGVLLLMYKFISMWKQNSNIKSSITISLEKIRNEGKLLEKIKLLALGIFFAQIIASPFSYLSLKLNSIFVSEIIIKSAPIFLLFLSTLLYKYENLNRGKITGVIVAVIGVLTIVFLSKDGVLTGETTALGIIVAVASLAGYTYSEIFKKKTREFISPETVLLLAYPLSFPVMIIFSMFAGASFTWIVYWPIFPLVIISVITLIWSYHVHDFLKPTLAKTLGSVSPVFLLVWAWILNGNLPQAVSWLGILAVVFGLYLIMKHEDIKENNPEIATPADSFDGNDLDSTVSESKRGMFIADEKEDSIKIAQDHEKIPARVLRGENKITVFPDMTVSLNVITILNLRPKIEQAIAMAI